MVEPGWVAEQPDVHLLPHIERACSAVGTFRILAERLEETVYVIVLDWSPPEPSSRRLRSDIFCLLASFVESSTHVRQRVLADAVEFDVTTGMLADETHFRTHGHLVRFRVEGEAALRLAG